MPLYLRSLVSAPIIDGLLSEVSFYGCLSMVFSLGGLDYSVGSFGTKDIQRLRDINRFDTELYMIITTLSTFTDGDQYMNIHGHHYVFPKVIRLFTREAMPARTQVRHADTSRV